MDHKFAEVDHRLADSEFLLAQMFAELPEKIFAFTKAA